jgi:NAD(P)-dependent dehydrogenase (short-subunit alcohol dehydrogenase family)
MRYPEMDGRVAIVTGGGKGLGLSISTALAAQGTRLAIIEVDAASAEEAAADLRSHGGEVLLVRADVSDPDAMREAVATVHEAYGAIDYLVSNAGISQRTPLTDITPEDFDRVMAVNVRGVWLGMKYAAPHMYERGGSIVNVASLMGLRSQFGVAAYTASKHAVVGLTKSGAIELGPRGVRVNAVCPGRHDTPMVRDWRPPDFSEEDWQRQIRFNHPATHRIGQPEELAAAVLFLCSAGASNIHGVALPVDGGWSAR